MVAIRIYQGNVYPLVMLGHRYVRDRARTKHFSSRRCAFSAVQLLTEHAWFKWCINGYATSKALKDYTENMQAQFNSDRGCKMGVPETRKGQFHGDVAIHCFVDANFDRVCGRAFRFIGMEIQRKIHSKIGSPRPYPHDYRGQQSSH